MRNSLYLFLFSLFLLGGCAQVSKWDGTNTAQRYTHAEVEQVQQILREESKRMGVSTALAFAVAHAESSFNPRALSSAGARGVMQIMPDTAEKEYGIDRERLWEPRVNIRLGLHFLKRLLKRYRGSESLALSYYNGGSAVGRWPNARVIPATRGYVKKVLRLKRRYSSHA